MNNLPEHPGDWLRGKAVPIGDSGSMRRNRTWIREAEAGRPGFADSLRISALEVLNSRESDDVRRSIAVLAVVGISEDVPTLRRVAAAGAFERDGRAAIDEN